MKVSHYVALGLLLIAVAGQLEKVGDNWHLMLTPGFASSFLGAIGSTLVALYSPKISSKEPDAVRLPVKASE